MKVESIAECSLGAFCNTFDLYLAIIGLEKQVLVFFGWPLKTGFTVFVAKQASSSLSQSETLKTGFYCSLSIKYKC